MSDARRYFTLEEANTQLPQIRAIVADALQRRKDIESRLAALAELMGELPDELQPVETDSPDVSRLKAEIRGRIWVYQGCWNQVEALGVVVKDPRIGLIDFYFRMDGRTVLLCWKYDEESVGHYHELDVGFEGRKPIEGSTRARLYN